MTLQSFNNAIITKIIPKGGNIIPKTHNIVTQGPQSPPFLSGNILIRIIFSLTFTLKYALETLCLQIHSCIFSQKIPLPN